MSCRAALAWALAVLCSARAAAIELPDHRRWYVIASRESQEEAIAVARESEQKFPLTMVVQSVNGWHGVVVGVAPEAGSDEELKRRGLIPRDAYFAQADRYTDAVWLTKALQLELYFPAGQ